jgi:hypothetical protein
LSTLTLLLRRAGLVSDDELARATGWAQEHAVGPVDAIAALGLLTEAGLVEFLHSRLMVPKVSPAILERVDRETVGHLPADLAWYHAMLPVSVDDANNLTLAMVDPTDVRAVEAAAGHTGAYLIRAVASLTDLRAALERHYGPCPPKLRGLYTPHQMPAMDSGKIRTESGAIRIASAHDSGVFAQGGVPSDSAKIPLSPSAFGHVLPRLVAAPDRDAILEALIDFLSQGFSRVIVFVHLHGVLRGKDARGPDLLLEAVTQVRIPTGGPSVFAEVIRTGAAFLGAWPQATEIDRRFAEAMGGIAGTALVLPIRVRDKVPVLVFACGTEHTVDRRSLTDLTEGVANALERLIFRRKSRDNVPQAR